jgi:hypothetical protein
MVVEYSRELGELVNALAIEGSQLGVLRGLLGCPTRQLGQLRSQYRIVPCNAMTVRKLTGQNRCERRTTQAIGNVPTGVNEGLTGQLIKMRCLDRGVPHEGVVPPALVVGDDQDNVRRSLGP